MKKILHIALVIIAFALANAAQAQSCCSKNKTASCHAKESTAQDDVTQASKQLTNCPLAGTPDCPLVKNCPKKGTPDCPYAKAGDKQTAQKKDEQAPACCKKKGAEVH